MHQDNKEYPRGDYKETAVRDLRKVVLDAIARKDPIFIELPKGNGDKVWSGWASLLPVLKLAEDSGVETNEVSLIGFPKAAPPESGLNLTDNYRRMNIKLGFHYTIDSNIYKDTLFKNFKILGLEASTQDLSSPPQPTKIANSLFGDFDKELVIKQGLALREQSPGNHRYVITQSGSEVGKRLSDAQVEDMVRFVREHDHSAFVTVVSDRAYLSQDPQHARHPAASSADQLVTGVSINEYSANLFAADAIIGTDSFYAWLGLGSMSIRLGGDADLLRGKGIFLYTIADPNVWLVPGAIPVEAISLKRVKRQWGLNMFGMMDKYDYLYNQDYEPGQVLDKEANIESGVHPQDFKLLKEGVKANFFVKY